MVENEKAIIDEIIKQRRLPYSVELVEIDGNRVTVRNNFGSSMVYIRKGEEYILEES